MKEERTTPLRAHDRRHAYPWNGRQRPASPYSAIKDFAAFLGHSPDAATPEELRAYQLHMTNAGVTPSMFDARIVALRFFFSITCGREEMKRHLQFRRAPRMFPIVPFFPPMIGAGDIDVAKWEIALNDMMRE